MPHSCSGSGRCGDRLSLELELDEEYPDGDAGGGVLLLDDDRDRARSTLRRIIRRLGLGNGVGARSLTGLNS